MNDVRRLTLPEKYPYKSVVDIVSANDTMLSEGDSAHYLQVGLSALQNISQALEACGGFAPDSVLDMPCGHGRVTRALKAAFPKSELYVCDIDRDGVEFCARAFGAHRLFSKPDFNAMNFGRTFDLIWVGSLITHLPEDVTEAFVRFVLKHLSPRGVAVVSSHGAYVAGRIVASLAQGGEAYGVANAEGWDIVKDYFRSGFGYADYPNIDLSVQHYGVSLASRRWIIEAVERCGGSVVFYQDHAWDCHHDIVAFKRSK